MADEENLNDYTGEFRKKSGHLEDFSREFLVKLTHVYEDTILFAYHAWATAYANKVGVKAAWDLAVSFCCSPHPARTMLTSHKATTVTTLALMCFSFSALLMCYDDSFVARSRKSKQRARQALGLCTLSL